MMLAVEMPLRLRGGLIESQQRVGKLAVAIRAEQQRPMIEKDCTFAQSI